MDSGVFLKCLADGFLLVIRMIRVRISLLPVLVMVPFEHQLSSFEQLDTDSAFLIASEVDAMNYI